MTTVRTLNSEYHFDFANRTVTRVVIDGFTMRRDNEVIRILNMEIPEIGEPMYMTIDVRLDGIVTIRRTSEVFDIL